ncbi:PREDICTED: uncharacterized protein LOC106899357 [Calidris pugnax]|uniref:uncharacterized protein LOC106899357 n=1 Tax=Calidris pugnax TaxID=198806 RepID=UPI00071D3A53|nr:PREDICTED: uncharacterized protein LOC106899357 [Calidris pugnax]
MDLFVSRCWSRSLTASLLHPIPNNTHHITPRVASTGLRWGSPVTSRVPSAVRSQAGSDVTGTGDEVTETLWKVSWCRGQCSGSAGSGSSSSSCSRASVSVSSSGSVRASGSISSRGRDMARGPVTPTRLFLLLLFLLLLPAQEAWAAPWRARELAGADGHPTSETRLVQEPQGHPTGPHGAKHEAERRKSSHGSSGVLKELLKELRKAAHGEHTALCTRGMGRRRFWIPVWGSRSLHRGSSELFWADVSLNFTEGLELEGTTEIIQSNSPEDHLGGLCISAPSCVFGNLGVVPHIFGGTVGSCGHG